ncbi:MAG: L-2-amino-thiazoline-4-carboxylic acid hydrolase [Desulfobacterales bacterium]|nr:L-2-amino-thiazoline-4-carboxylic acid hydrolase [Desulfobacterales bacterium]
MRWLIFIFRWSYRIRIPFQKLEGRNRSRQRPELGRITNDDVYSILEESWKNYRQLSKTAPKGDTLGSRMMLKNGVWSLAMYRAILKIVFEKEYAIELCGDVLWKNYQRSVWRVRLKARLSSRKPQEQMNRMQEVFLKILEKPGYDLLVIQAPDAFAYDIYRCPVHDYFKSLGPEELEFFRKTWCTFDFPFAEHLVKGGKHERQRTLSHGDEMCDMRWMVDAHPKKLKGEDRTHGTA